MASGQRPICIRCNTLQSPERPGAFFDVRSEHGDTMTVWLCNECAIPLGPPQGPIRARRGMTTKL